MKDLFLILLILSFLPTNVFAESERPQAIVIPISSLGGVKKSQKEILQNTLEDKLKRYFTLISQERFEQAQEKAFKELDYEECTEDQCIMLIQEMLQVENVFHLQVIREDKDTQLSLTWRTLDEKKKQTDICKNCNTFDLNERIHKLLLIIIGKAEDQDTIVTRNSKDWLRFNVGSDAFALYYKFSSNYGVGFSSITSYETLFTWASVGGGGKDPELGINGYFLQLGYDYETGNLIFNANIGLLLVGRIIKYDEHFTSKELEQFSCYNTFFNLGYKGDNEYGISVIYSNLKTKSGYKISSVVDTNPQNITEIKPALWFGMNW